VDAVVRRLDAADEQVPERNRQPGVALRRLEGEVAACAESDRLGRGRDSSAECAEGGIQGGDDPGEPFGEMLHGGVYN